MRRVAVKVAYSGSDFSGSQIQPEKVTVEGEILSNLLRIGNGKDEEWFDLKGSSRTDAGVNATGNVFVFNTDLDDYELLSALNAVSENVFYKGIATVDDSFNPRHALYREYRYLVPKFGIDVDRMKECASLFQGKHDFIKFCKFDGKPTEIEMEHISVDEKNEYIEITFRSRFFLWNLIRRLSAAMIAVGKGRYDLDHVRRALDGENLTFGLARADALTLTDVVYPDLEFDMIDTEPLKRKVRETKFTELLRQEFLESL